MKRSKYIIIAVLLVLSILLVGCADKSVARIYELISIERADSDVAPSLTIKNIEYFYLTLRDKSLRVNFAYIKPPIEGSKEPGESVIAEETAKCKLSKDKATYAVKSGIFRGNLIPSVAVIESHVELDGVKYAVIFVLKA